MLNSFKGLKIFQSSEFILLALFAFVIPFSWRIATFIMIVIFINCILKGIFEEGFKINPLQYKNKSIYFISIAFWALYAISFLYSENTAEARIQIGKKLSFLLLPLFFLFSNLSYLTKKRVRTIMYFFVFGILALFFTNLILAIYDVSITDNPQSDRFYDPYFLELGTGYIHHTYISIYTCLGIAFSFTELFSKTKFKTKLFNLLTTISLIAFTVISNSRAGLLCIIFIFIILFIWLMFVKKEKIIGICFGIVIISISVVCSIYFKESLERLSSTIKNLRNVEFEDRRIGLYNGYKDLLYDKFWFGVGAGDRSDETLNSYIRKKEEIISRIQPVDSIFTDDFYQKRTDCLESLFKRYNGHISKSALIYAKRISNKHGCDHNSLQENLSRYFNINVAINSNCNAHNQYFDTIITVGIIGLILYLAMLFMPIYLWIKNKNFNIVFFTLLFIFAFNSLFESVFERQMGIMFFVFFYFLLFHGCFCQDNSEENKSLDVK